MGDVGVEGHDGVELLDAARRMLTAWGKARYERFYEAFLHGAAELQVVLVAHLSDVHQLQELRDVVEIKRIKMRHVGDQVEDSVDFLIGEPGWTVPAAVRDEGDRKSTRLNSSHVAISYAVFCLKKKK